MGLDHESFFLTPETTNWNFCKTARKPYDLLVCAVLLSAYNILGYELSSDGGFEDWQPAIDFYLDTVYDVQTLSQEEKDELVAEVLPSFLLEDL